MPVKSISFFLTLLLLAFVPFQVFGQTASWDAVKALGDAEVAVQKTGGGTVFGKLVSADDSSIAVRIVEKGRLDAASATIDRAQVEKLWLAKLRLGQRNLGKGTLVGTGVGAAAGLAIFGSLKGDEYLDGIEILFIPIGIGVGAGVGAVAGLFWKKKPKKGKLVYGK